MVAYVIARIDVQNADDYATYASQTVALAEAAGGRFLVKGGPQVVLEGEAPARHVIVEFETLAAAQDWYNSEPYQKILPIALRSSARDLIIVEGL